MTARQKKEEKYKPIIKYAEDGLKRNNEEIRIKYKVQDVKVDCKYIIISNLGVVPDTTVKDVCRIISDDEKEKVRYGKMWLKRMVN
jgi:ribosome-interacting GTPase 1